MKTMIICLTALLLAGIGSAQNSTNLPEKSFRRTSLTFGGNGVNVSKVNNQLTVMMGGRGSATFNNRYTIGGGGWGMIKGVKTESSAEGVYNFVKIGYGGVDVGYLLIQGERVNLGAKILFAGGAAMKESLPESENNDFRLFPVLEPTIYFQISLNKLLRVEMGSSYRNAMGINLPYISTGDVNGFSCYIGFLVSTCECK